MNDEQLKWKIMCYVVNHFFVIKRMAAILFHSNHRGQLTRIYMLISEAIFCSVNDLRQSIIWNKFVL